MKSEMKSNFLPLLVINIGVVLAVAGSFKVYELHENNALVGCDVALFALIIFGLCLSLGTVYALVVKLRLQGSKS